MLEIGWPEFNAYMLQKLDEILNEWVEEDDSFPK